MWRKVLIFILATLLLENMVLIESVLGQGYPTRPIEFLCAYPPGGGADLNVRLTANIAQKYLGQPLIVVSRTGAGGAIAAAEVASSNPDGYKIVQLSTSFFALTVKTQNIKFNPDHLTPLTNFYENRNGLIVRTDSPWKTLNELLGYAIKNPGKPLRWGHTGRGAPNYISTLLLFRKAGVKTIDIPYVGGGELAAGLLGGHLDAIAQTYASVREQVGAGLLKHLVIYSDRRLSGELANVPTALELGFPEATKVKTLMGVHAHRDTPENIKKTLIDAFKKTFEDPEFKTGMQRVGEEPRFGGPEFIKEEIKKCEEVGVPILRELGLFYKEQK